MGKVYFSGDEVQKGKGNMRRCISLIGFVLLLLGMVGRTEAQGEAELFRLRVENTVYGRIEVSTDGGKRFRLLGRITQPAAKPMVDKSASTVGVVLRSTKDYFTFSVALGQSLILAPQRTPPQKGKGSTSPNLPKEATLQTNLPKTHPLFGEFVPATQTPLRLQVAQGVANDIPDNFLLSEESVFIFIVSKTERGGNTKEQIAPRWDLLADSYQVGATARAKANRLSIITGILTLKPKLPDGEPDPIVYVTYHIDGEQVSAQNTIPFSHDWDTKQAQNGEHVVEIRALNRQGTLLTKAKVMVVVNNP
jgi:hypothetical protein